MSTWTDEKHNDARAAAQWPETPHGIQELLSEAVDEIDRLHALTTVDDAMVKRMAEAIYLRCFLRCNTWATEARAKASLEAAKAGYIGYIGEWKAACEDARAALDAALGTGGRS